MNLLLVIAIFVLLIVAHEFGHFIVAKLFRVRVDEFGIGYPPRAFTFGKWGGTEYTINWLPFGGFVRLFGEQEEDGVHGRGSFIDAKRPVQACILVAGIVMNVLLAWGLFTWSFAMGVPQSVPVAVSGEEAHLFITDVVAGSPAASAGIAPGDEITRLSDEKGIVAVLSPDDVQAFVRDRGGKTLTLAYLRAATSSSVTVKPANAVVPGSPDRAALGVGLALVVTRPQPIGEAMLTAAKETWDVGVSVVGGLGQIVRDSIFGSLDLQNIVGPVGIAGYVGQAAHNGWGNVVRLVAFISVNLAVINLVPIPMLDGGRLVILGFEALRKKPASKLVVNLINTIGLALIIVLMIVVTYHDIARLLA